jgi:hypothetical protein
MDEPELKLAGLLATQSRVDLIRCSTEAGSGHPILSPSVADWEALGFDVSEASDWGRANFDVLEVAMALGDGFTLVSAVYGRSMLHQTAAAWRDAGLGCVEGLHWHEAGFTSKEALRWRPRDHNVSSARAIRDEYVKDE